MENKKAKEKSVAASGLQESYEVLTGAPQEPPKHKHWVLALLRKYFLTGLLAITPLWFCYLLISIVFTWTSNFSMPYTLPIVKIFFRGEWVYPAVKCVSFIISIITISFAGFLTTKLFGKKLLVSIENFIAKLPVLGSLYNASKKFLDFIFKSKDNKNAFKQVVLVPFPSKEIYSIAFLTGERLIKSEKYFSVFMPTTPNPTTGFLLLYKEHQVINTNFTIEDAFQYIISGGVVCSYKNLDKITEGKNAI